MSAQRKKLLKWRIAPLAVVLILAIALALGFTLSASATIETNTTDQLDLVGGGGGQPTTTQPPVTGTLTVNLTVVNMPAGVALTDLAASIKGPSGPSTNHSFNGSGQIVLSSLSLGWYEVKGISCDTDPYDFLPPAYIPTNAKVELTQSQPNKTIQVTVTWPTLQQDQHDWTGNGADEWNTCEWGGNYHWVFTTGGTDVLTAHLYVTYDDGSSNNGAMGQNGNGSFDVWLAGPDTVKSAYVIYTYLGGVGLSCVTEPGNMVLTISESQCNLPPVTTTTCQPTTTTAPPQTTTTTCQPTTTTAPPQTTTTAPCQTTTTAPAATTTTAPCQTTTTVKSSVTTTTDRDKNPLTGESDSQQSQRQFMWLWIALAVICVLVAAGVGFSIWHSRRSAS